MSRGGGFEAAILRNLLTQTTQAYEEQVAALLAEKELAQVTLASIADGVITTDAAGLITYLNPVAEKLTGWSAGEALGKPLGQIFCLVEERAGAETFPSGERLFSAGRRTDLDRQLMLLRRDGKRFAVESSVAPIRDAAGEVVGVVIVFQDISERRLLALQLAHQATHDALTGLLNRQAFDSQLQLALEDSRTSGREHALCYMDLDQFKVVNDTCGHLAGDELLCRVTTLLQETVRVTDISARLGGDEFGLLLPGCDLEQALAAAQQVHAALQGLRFTWRDKPFAVGASIGVVPITRRFQRVTNLMSAADHACYLAKEKGRNRIQVYHHDDAEVVQRTGEMNWVVRIQKTLEENHFRLFSQTIEPLAASAGRDRRLRFEVLLRMVDEHGRIHPPSDFIRAAERYGLMRSIDRWVLSTTLATLAAQPAGVLDHLASCAINLSAVSVGDESFLGFVHEQLGNHRVEPAKICFEITETAAVENLPQATRLIGELTDLGCRFALDDFGSGMSSYSALKDLRVDYLKIDGRFVKDMGNDELDRAMVESINQIGHVLGLETIAEAVTTGAILERLRAIGVDYAQGHWLSQPQPLEEVWQLAVL